MKAADDAGDNEAELVCYQPKADIDKESGRVLCTFAAEFINKKERAACALSTGNLC